MNIGNNLQVADLILKRPIRQINGELSKPVILAIIG
jgi:hypothetical protein